ncbi:hypothetical protein RhoFasB10_03779 [Rhodococcus sp. B10]|nr:hypothetical protein [Rhodococcus sp. B10]
MLGDDTDMDSAVLVLVADAVAALQSRRLRARGINEDDVTEDRRYGLRMLGETTERRRDAVPDGDSPPWCSAAPWNEHVVGERALGSRAGAACLRQAVPRPAAAAHWGAAPEDWFAARHLLVHEAIDVVEDVLLWVHQNGQSVSVPFSRRGICRNA